MKIQYMSDLHMELTENSRYLKNVEFPVTGNIFELAGDTFYLYIPTPSSAPSSATQRSSPTRWTTSSKTSISSTALMRTNVLNYNNTAAMKEGVSKVCIENFDTPS